MRHLVYLFFAIFFLLPSHFCGAQDREAQAKHLLGLYRASLSLDKAGTLWWWGGGNPVPKALIHGITGMAAGGDTIFVIKEDSTLWGRSGSNYGELGIITKERTKDYVKIFTDVRAVAAVDNTVYAIKKDQTLWTWGAINSFQGFTQKNKTPRKILDKVVQVAAGPYHTVALREDGTLWSWGSNRCGRLGIDTDIDSRIRPGKVDMEPLVGHTVVSIFVSNRESFAVTEDGQVWRWGDDQPKCDDYSSASSPERIAFIDNVRQIVADNSSSYYMTLKKDGTLWVWGGRFGIPGVWKKAMKLLDDVAEIAMGENHAMALKKDGTVWTWGDNGDGQLGPGRDKDEDYTPRQVIFPEDKSIPEQQGNTQGKP